MRFPEWVIPMAATALAFEAAIYYWGAALMAGPGIPRPTPETIFQVAYRRLRLPCAGEARTEMSERVGRKADQYGRAPAEMNLRGDTLGVRSSERGRADLRRQVAQLHRRGVGC